MNDLEQVNEFLSVTGLDFVKRVHELQNVLLSLPTEVQAEMPITHHFGHKTYVREMFSPTGSIIVGKTHRYAHVCIVSQGRAIIYDEHGSREIQAPCSFVTQPGIKRLFVVLKDLTFSTVHHANTSDLEGLERELIVPDDEVEQFRKDLNLEV